MSAMNYRHYLAQVAYDAADRIFVGHIAGINDVVGFHGESVAEPESAFHEAVDDYIEACATAGKAPDKPYSGRVMFRVDPSVHAKAALAAKIRGLSLNQWAEEAMIQKAEQDLIQA
jgi:predicted HicB family RNase H-like nuclease